MSVNSSSVEFDYEWVISQIDTAAIMKHVQALSGMGSRIPGYPGSFQAARYIRNQFLNAGLTEVTTHNFTIAVPIDYGADLTVLGSEERTFKLYPFWPNLVAPVTTPSEGITGPLIYGGKGYLKDFDGKPLDGSIVLMDIKSGKRWIQAAELGAKAVIFIGSEDAIRDEFKLKILDTVPFNFPRFYIKPQDAQQLLEMLKRGNVTVNMKSTMRWETVKGVNIIGYAKGENPDLYVLITAHYDSFSYVPSLAPGAEEALGISTLLELARFYTQHPAKYTIVFIAFSGSDLGLQGSRWFVKDWVEGKWGAFGKKIVLQINLDLSSESPTPVPTNGGSYYQLLESVGEGWIPRFTKFYWPLTDQIQTKLGKNWNISEETLATMLAWSGISGLRVFGGGFLPPLDHEPLININGPGMSLTTAHAWRTYWGTPNDTPENINLDNLKEQLEYDYSVIYALTNTDLRPDIIPPWSLMYNQEHGAKWVDVKGVVAEYNYQKGWYTPVANAIFAYRMLSWWNDVGVGKVMRGYMSDVGLWSYVISDSEGRVFIPGLANSMRLGMWTVLAFVVDPETGNVVYAPDMGKYHFIPQITELNLLLHPYDFGYYAVFKCGSIVFFHAGDPSFMNVDEGGTLLWTVNDHRTHAAPDSWGREYTPNGGTAYTVTMIHVQPGVPVEVMVQTSYAMRYPLGILMNATEEKRDGYGLTAEAGEQVILKCTPLHFARDLYWLNKDRVASLTQRGISGVFAAGQERVGELIKEAEDALSRYDYSRAYSKMAEAWNIQRGNYVQVRRLIEDYVSVAPYFALLLLPFAFLGERLFFSWYGKKRLLGISVLYAIYLTLLYLFHPGLSMAANPLMLLVAAFTIILAMPMVSILIGKLQETMRLMRFQLVGRTFGEMRWGEVITTAFTVGSQYIRRRRLLSTLSLLSVILITASLISFTSVEANQILEAKQIRGEAPYNGIIIRHKIWICDDIHIWPAAFSEPYPALGDAVLQDLMARYGEIATISPRAWRYPFPNQYKNHFILRSGNKTVGVSAILGLTSREDELLKVSVTLAEGRWFVPGESGVAIISQETAKALDAHVGDAIYISGMRPPRKIVGIVKDELFNSIKDIDQEMITPRDWKPPATDVHLKVRDVIIIPYEDCIGMNGWVVSASIKFKDEGKTAAYAEKISGRYLNPFMRIDYGFDGKVYTYTYRSSLAVTGLQFQIVPIIIAMFTLVNAMLGSIYSRIREMETFSTVGMSPTHIALMFLCEQLIYSVVGAMTGYIAGMLFVRASSTYLAGLFLNYSSSWVFICMLMMMGATMASSIYPLIKVSKLVTPSLERKWKIPPPAGNEWTIPVPYATTIDIEASGIIGYVAQFMQDHMGARPEDFWVHKLAYKEWSEPGREYEAVTADVSLSPYERGVRQNVQFISTKMPDGHHNFQILITRIQGTRSDWIHQNRTFIDALRKRVLVWSFLTTQEKEKALKQLEKLKKKRKRNSENGLI